MFNLKLSKPLALTSSLQEVRRLDEQINPMKKQADKYRVGIFHRTTKSFPNSTSRKSGERGRRESVLD